MITNKIEIKLSDLIDLLSSDSVSLRDSLFNALRESDSVVIDFAGIKSFSPSFAYEHFGKLFDTFGPSLASKISFKNDPFGFGKRVYDAIERRTRVVA